MPPRSHGGKRYDSRLGLEDVETQAAATRRSLPVLTRGTIVGRYVILDKLGVGGMGVVYRAYDPDLDRRIALKLVRTVSEDATARLIREAQALAKVSHPNIVQIFDVGVFDETVFIAMELVEGQTLSTWNRESKPTWRVLLAHLIDAGRGLAAAHAAGLVHRDFKPQNAIVGADGRVRVLDFGVARSAAMRMPDGSESDPLEASLSGRFAARLALPPDDSDATTNTVLEAPRRASERPGVSDPAMPQIVVSRITGTPVYMAPEQRRHGLLDARADQFAFAVTCWELLHGARPFQGESLRAYLDAAATGQFRPPPPGNPTPAWVRRVLLRALSAAPGDRYRAMDDVIAALAADPARRRRNLAAILLGGAAAITAVVAIATRPASASPCEDAARHLDGVWDPTVAAHLDEVFRATGASFAPDTTAKVRGALDRRADAWTAMHREACRATRVSGEQSAQLLDLRMGCLARRREELHALVDQLTASPDASRVAGAVEAVAQLPSVAACADRDALTAMVPLPEEPAQRAAIARTRTELATAKALLWTGQWPDARSRAESIQAAAHALGWAPLVAEAAYLRGRIEHNTGSFAAAELALTEAAQAAARAHLDDLGAQAWSELAWVVGYEEERPLEGLALATAAEATALRADASRGELAHVAETRALIWFNKGDHAAALREADAALAAFEKAPDAGALDAVDELNTIAMIETAQGDYAKAEATQRQVLDRRRAVLGEGHPKVADSIDNLGVVRFHQGAYAEAKADYEQALAIRVAALGPDARDVGTSHNNLGGLLMETGDDAGAATHLEAALRIYEKTLGPDHGDLAIPLSNLGELATRRGDFALAITDCERALALDEKGGPEDPKLAFDLVCVGEAQLGHAQPRSARAPLERALALREHGDGDRGELARTQLDLALALYRTGERSKAHALAVTARDGFAAAGEAWKARHAAAVAWLAHPR